MKQPHFLHVDINSQKLKVEMLIKNFLGENECGQSGLGILKLTVSQE